MCVCDLQIPLQQMADLAGEYMANHKLKFLKKYVPTKVHTSSNDYTFLSVWVYRVLHVVNPT